MDAGRNSTSTKVARTEDQYGSYALRFRTPSRGVSLLTHSRMWCAGRTAIRLIWKYSTTSLACSRADSSVNLFKRPSSRGPATLAGCRSAIQMAKVSGKKPTRRDFVKQTGIITAGLGPFFLFPERARAKQKTLRIAHWSHFVPGFDEWFEREYAKEWGRQHDTNVVVDHVSVDKIGARAAAEVAAGKGHDLFMFPWPPAVYHQHAIDHTEIYQAVGARHGTVNEVGHKSTFNPKTKRYFAFADSWIPAPVHYFDDYWSEANTPLGPSNYDTLRAGARKIRVARGIPGAVSLA